MKWFKKYKRILLGKRLLMNAWIAVCQLKTLKKAQEKELQRADAIISMVMEQRRVIKALIKTYDSMLNKLKEEL